MRRDCVERNTAAFCLGYLYISSRSKKNFAQVDRSSSRSFIQQSTLSMSIPSTFINHRIHIKTAAPQKFAQRCFIIALNRLVSTPRKNIHGSPRLVESGQARPSTTSAREPEPGSASTSGKRRHQHLLTINVCSRFAMPSVDNYFSSGSGDPIRRPATSARGVHEPGGGRLTHAHDVARRGTTGRRRRPRRPAFLPQLSSVS